MLLASTIFILSLLGIIGLFGVKYIEEHHEKIILSPDFREMADERAIRLKNLLLEKRAEVEKLPGTVLHLTHVAIHRAALGAARFASFLEARAHRLADFVSHKHHFKKRETRSEFLKQVGEHTISNNHNNGFGSDSSQNGGDRL